MPQRCPFCKTKLWTDPWFGRGKLACPRCENEFRPTVPWWIFRLLVLLILILSVVLVATLPDQFEWLIVLVIAVGFFVWYLPRLANIHPIGPIAASDGPTTPEDREWESKFEEDRDRSRFREMVLLVFVAILGLLVVLRYSEVL